MAMTKLLDQALEAARPAHFAGATARDGYWLMYQPPLGEMTWPVMNLASSLAR